jgi:tetratricopeptide (TPR) repeat protein
MSLSCNTINSECELLEENMKEFLLLLGNPTYIWQTKTRGALPLLAFALMLSVASVQAQGQIIMDGKEISQAAYDSFTAGRNLLHSNNNADAVETLRKAAELAPDNADILHTYAIALAKTGQSDLAIQQLRAALNINSNLAPTWITLGGLYQSTGQLDKAIETYRTFLSRFPTDRDAKKIASLVTGLEGERAKMVSTYGQTGQLQLSQTDYFVEVTREGVIRWQAEKMPLKVYITPGETVPGYRPQFADLLKQSFAAWSQASNGLISFALVERPEQAQIICQWSNDPSKFKNIAEAGHAVLDSSTRSGLVRGTITILTVPLVEQVPVTDNRMRRTCLHEIGHVLGLAGHTANPDDAMFHTMGVADTWKDLTQRDSNTIVRLYTLMPQQKVSR